MADPKVTPKNVPVVDDSVDDSLSVNPSRVAEGAAPYVYTREQEKAFVPQKDFLEGKWERVQQSIVIRWRLIHDEDLQEYSGKNAWQFLVDLVDEKYKLEDDLAEVQVNDWLANEWSVK